MMAWQGGPDAEVLLVQAYARKRIARTSTIHGLAGMAAIAASTYKAYLGEGLGPLSFLKQLRIPHPGRVRALTPLLTPMHVIHLLIGADKHCTDNITRSRWLL